MSTRYTLFFLHRRSRGFTLLEVLVASLISTIIIGGVTSALVHTFRSWRAAGVRSELHMNLEISMERLRHDLRLSSVGIGLMAFYPADAAEYTAISFPLATPGSDGLLPRDSAGNVIWDTTVVYHVRAGSPDELVRSTFHPRNQSASAADFYDQLAIVVQSQDVADIQAAALHGETATSKVIFRNLVNMTFRPPETRFDGYAPQYERARPVNWGSVVLSNGVHELTFTIEGKNDESTGYKLGVDRFAMSYSGSPREAEWFLPEHTRPTDPYFSASTNGGTIIAEDMSMHGASWSGRSQLTFMPTIGAASTTTQLTFYVHNDIWNDTTFDNPPGKMAWNCRRGVDMSFTNEPPFIPEVVIAVNHDRSWEAVYVTATTNSSMIMTGIEDVVNVIHGSADTSGPEGILFDGDFVRFAFSAGTNAHLHVRNVRFGERGVDDDFAIGDVQQVRFDGSVHIRIDADTLVWSDWIPYVIDREKSYLLKWQRKNAFNDNPVFLNSASVWEGDPAYTFTYINHEPTNTVIALEGMEVLYSNAVYRSGVFDTRVSSPEFTGLSWTQVEHGANGNIRMRVRSSDFPDMHDADWYPTLGLTDNENSNISWINGGRYVQYEASFTSAGDHTKLPVLRDVTIAWEAPTGIVDLVVDLARGPDYGIVTAEVNGQSFVRGVEIQLEIFQEGPFGTEKVTGITEVRPLNTGR